LQPDRIDAGQRLAAEGVMRADVIPSQVIAGERFAEVPVAEVQVAMGYARKRASV